MILRRGFRFLLQPTPQQRHHFACAAGCARLVWNTALALQKQRLADQLPLLSYEDLSPLLKLWKKEKPFLKEAPSQPLQQKLIEREQRKLSNKRKGSKNYQKQRAKLQRANKQLRDKREDFQHRTSHHLSQNHAVIVLEKLRVKNMTKSAKGTLEEPGQNVRQKAGLNRAILRQGWSEFKRQLKYKCEWRGGRCIEVPAEYTSQRCSECAFISPENRTTQSEFACISCGHAENADINAAKNIKALGLLELQKPQEAKPVKKKKQYKKRTAGEAGIACCEPVPSKAQKRAKALKATT